MNLTPLHRSILKKDFYLWVDLSRHLNLVGGHLVYLIKTLNHPAREQHSQDVHFAKS